MSQGHPIAKKLTILNFIVFDLEATCWKNRPKQTQEIIEIGAIKFNRYAEVTGHYNRFIRPVLHPILSPFCKELTTIEQVTINRAANFVEVIENFQDWIEIFDEEYLLCSWGKFDKQLLRQDCELHDVEEDWLDPYINLKEQYREIRRLNRTYGLKKALEYEGFEFEGTQHRAYDDAENLTKLFKKFFDVWQY